MRPSPLKKLEAGTEGDAHFPGKLFAEARIVRRVEFALVVLPASLGCSGSASRRTASIRGTPLCAGLSGTVEVADLAGLLDIMERFKGILNRSIRCPTMDEIEVDVIRAQSLQEIVHFCQNGIYGTDPFAFGFACIGPLTLVATTTSSRRAKSLRTARLPPSPMPHLGPVFPGRQNSCTPRQRRGHLESCFAQLGVFPDHVLPCRSRPAFWSLQRADNRATSKRWSVLLGKASSPARRAD